MKCPACGSQSTTAFVAEYGKKYRIECLLCRHSWFTDWDGELIKEEQMPERVPYEEAELIRQCAQRLGLYGFFDSESVTAAIDVLKVQRDDLLAACEKAKAILIDDNGRGTVEVVIFALGEAIKRAKRGA